MPKLIYLDSSDFSNLSVPDDELSDEYRAILNSLREHNRSGTAKFFMSAVHFSEAVHAAGAHKPAAMRRADLMRELCGSNILRFPTDLPALELQKAIQSRQGGRLSLEELTSKSGEWFGVQLGLRGLVEARTNVNRQMKDALAKKMPRRERRKLLSELDFRKNSSYGKWRQLLATSPEIPLEYPLSLFNRNTVLAWLFGEISDAQFRDKILKIVHDPYIMFKHVLDEINHRQELYDIFRKQGLEMAQKIETSANSMISALSTVIDSGFEFDMDTEIDKVFSQPSFWRRIIQSFVKDADLAHIADSELSQIVESCPALFAFIEINEEIYKSRAYSYLARIRAGNKSVKQAKLSDFADLMHCHYAPYFDIFRCDASFGAILKKHKPLRRRIADRIADVVRMLSDTSPADRRDAA